MASRLDDLLNNVVNRLQSVGVGRGTQRQTEQVPYGFRPYQGSQNLATERLVNIGGKTYIGPKEQPPRQDYSGDRYYGLQERNIVQADRPAYTPTPMPMSGGLFGATQGPVTVADTIRGAVPDAISEYEMRQLQIEQNIRDEEDANAPKDQGFGQSTLERKLYDAKIAEDRRRREELVKNNIPIERRANEERRMLSQAQTEKERRGLFDYGGMDMPSQQQTIEIDPIVLEIPDQPTDEEVIRTLEQDYADLAAAGADTATLSALAREIDSYRDRQSSLPSIVSEAAASDVIENAPVNYDAFGNVIAQPETEVLMSRQAQITDPPIEMWNTSYGQLSKQGKWFGGQDAVTKYKADNPTVQLTPAQEYVIANEGYLPDPYYLNKEEKAKGILTQGVGQTKRKGKDYIALGFPATYEDRIADLKRKMGADLVDAVEQNEPEKFKALADLAYRGDIGPKWAGHYKADRLDDAYKEFWNRKKFGGAALDRVAKNSMILFGKGVPKGTKTSDGKKW